ncbi:hypothetical protein MSG28_007115 [Choristoneura fumiferana]|uniref:Uncharacterized protein n=1 Tax=Choristoneura fumiferana TaxID=7141 RepID=A0ACC0JMN3_CHOFU|nr:hypothetical protein MSG28_007115 [Choristoneura fumiferana]
MSEMQCFRVTFSYPSIVEDQQCFELLGPKPELFQKCNTNASCPTWFTGPWKPCDQLCGEGKQTRQVVCHQRTNGRVEVLAEEECADERPAEEQSCMLSPCDGVDWVASEWSGCDTCLSTVKSRVVECSTKDGELVDPKFCANHPKPKLEQPCNADDLPPCQVQWYATQWSNCSVECGKGVKTRRVFCGQFDAVSIRVVSDSKCDNETRYNDTTPCEIPKEKCPAKWFAGPWTECTKLCGGGEQYRKAMCLNGGKVSLACAEEDTPESMQTCNTGPCDSDETIPVDAMSTPVMDDDNYEDCIDEDEEEGEGDEVGAEVAPGELDRDLMSSDAPYAPTSEGSGDTESEFTAETGSGTGSTWSTYEGSGEYTDGTTETGDTGPTSETPETATDGTGSDLTKETSSTVSGETESEVTEESGATDATSSTDVTPTDSSDVESESGASTVSPSSTETNITETTESGATEETSESSATDSSVSEGFTDSTTENTETEETGSTVTEETVTSITEETGSTATDVTVSTVAEETDSTITEETVTTVTDETGSTATEETVSTETSPTATEETVSTEISPTATDETVSTEISPTTTDDSSKATDTSTTEIAETTETSDKSSSDVTETGTSDLSTTESSDRSTTEGVTLSESSTESTNATDSTEITGSTESTVTDETSDAETEETTGTSEEVTTESIPTGSTVAETGSTETDVTSSTESEGSTVSDLTSESGSTTEPSTQTEATTASGLTSESEPTESTVSTETDLTESTTAGGSTTEFTEETSESSDTTPWDWSSTVAIYTKKPRCRPRKTPAKCIKSMFGCCPDGKTPAAGPFDEASPSPSLSMCLSRVCMWSCCFAMRCSARSTISTGTDSFTDLGLHDNKICTRNDSFTDHGFHDKHIKVEACPHPKTCNETKFGCCPDGVSPAAGLRNKGCPSSKCKETLYGCCKSDNKTPAEGNDQEGCPPPPPPCKSSEFGCCKDGKTEAKGPLKEGCPETTTTTTAYGCCPDGKTPAHGPGSEGCCLLYPYGCCPDNYKPADGPHLEGCGCQNARFGCCPDNVTIARGYNKEGCGCEHTEHGCCPDKHTEASGPDYEGCSCHTYQFGCCPDGITTAKGPNLQGCDCRQSTHGCCGDGQTAATGPDQVGCDCASSKYGCCPDGQTEAKGEKFSGCTDVPENKQAACALPAVQGPCHNYSAYWFFDTQYGGCSRFWYGGCEGNGNRFATKEECEDVCVRPSDKEVCHLPKSIGGCGDAYQRWYYDSEYEQCGQFQYTGCLGNANNFETREKCQKQCQPARNEDQCKQPIERGSCAGNFVRWGFNAEAGRCEQFSWGGCEGNANRFSSDAACVLRCQPPGALQPECTLPQEAGNCTDKEPAWSFSETENRCLPFYYSGCGGNGNRFSDERSCAEACPSAFGVLQMRCQLRSLRWDTSSASNFTGCLTLHAETQQCKHCCFTAGLASKMVVAIRADLAQEREMCTLPAEAGDCATYRINWYFDTANQRCRQFYYGGCGGNGNNFESEELCRASCAGAPPTTTTQRPAEAGPFKEEYCFLETSPGPCSGNETRWAYSAEAGDCRPFTYGGCEGNRNNFPSREYCLYYCKPTQDLCQLPMRTGHCSESLPRWFYDAATDRCSQFAYSGCDGNDNNFESAEYCERRCRASPAPSPTSAPALTTTTVAPLQLPAECTVSGLERCAGGRVWMRNPTTSACEPYDPTEREGSCEATGVFLSPEACERTCGTFMNLEVCRYPVDAGSCTGAERKFYYDQSSSSCLQFTYSGCYGGPNRFSTIDECESVCMPETDPCKLPAEPGNCLEYHAMWYYDEARDDCNQFYWTGCDGNGNRFATLDECLGSCQRSPRAPLDVTTTSTPRPAPTPLTPAVSEECRTPQSLSPCGVEQKAFYFNSESGACAEAMSGACRYSNSYRTVEECERQCGAFRGQDVCRVPLDPGPCRAAIPKVYWDLAEGRCREFTYGGCAGGSNRFSTVDECEEICGNLSIDAACRLAAAAGAACAGAGAAGRPRWHHSPLHGECREFIYLGCGGNRNNFRTKQECERHCLPPDDVRFNEITPVADCRAAEAECAAQRCQHGQVVARDADGCRRCQCAPAPPPDCARAEAHCASLQCPRGVNRTTDSEGCESCSCNPERRHPCSGVQCPEGQRCGATPYRDPITQETLYATECRLNNKPGLCPADPTPIDSCSPEEIQRQQQCRVDPDCRGAAKCCRVGCSQRCIEPEVPASPTAPPTTTVTSPPYVPGKRQLLVGRSSAVAAVPRGLRLSWRCQVLPQAPAAPVASPETQLSVSSAEGGVATLRCLFHSNPPPKITWRFGQITIDGTSGRYRLTSDGALEIVSLYRDDAGVYICIAENELGTAQQEIRLQVNGPVTSAAGIAGESRVTVVGELGHPLSIRCLAYGYPQPSIAWYHGPRSEMVPYDSKEYEARANVLLIRSLGIDTLGEYVCQVYNGVTKPASLTVEVWAYERGGERASPYLRPRGDVVVVTPRAPPPDLTLPTTQPIVEFPDVPIYTAPVRTEIRAEQTTLSAGAELNLPCEVDGHPEPDVYWSKDGVPLQSGDRIQATNARLTVSSVTVNDSGVYGCHASNGHSQHSSTVQINVQGLYIPPQCTDNPFFANCALIVRSKYCNHKYYSAFCCKSCVEAGFLNPQALTLQADQSWMKKKK